MESAQVRRSFVDFFVARGHKHVPGASLIPDALSTTLFTIAGMEPFVPAFLGSAPAPAARVVTVQRCMRVAGGKNDLDNVGRTGRHATFLEMLGNFSFGDYYKREAVTWAWEYLTSVLGLPPERLRVSVYVDDEEAAAIWRRDVGLPADRISRFREDNFWDMGPTGPCGPCSEIFFDLGERAGCGRPECGPGCSHCDRYVELWNLVFQQYDRDGSGELHPLPKPCIDTGMGFERLCMVLGDKTSIFDIDLYQDIMTALPAVAAAVADGGAVNRRVIADHARATAFLVADGVMPTNSDRGYVLRFLTRRAIRSGKVLGYDPSFFSALVPAVIATLRDGYPELAGMEETIAGTLRAEERQFDQTLARGEARLHSLLVLAKSSGASTLDGRSIFELHDTYGFPPELTAEIAAEGGIAVDLIGYRNAMQEQRERARRDALAKRVQVRVEPAGDEVPASQFVGYGQLAAHSRVVALLDRTGGAVQSLETGVLGSVVLDRTPFYAERGGQMGDRGVLAGHGFAFAVSATEYADKSQRSIMHLGRVTDGVLSIGANVDAMVDPWWRREIRRHHTATHLLQRALKEIAGESVAQRGSAVFADRTRFDFDSPVGALTEQRRNDVAVRVNELIRADFHEQIESMPFAEAVARGAVYMKSENYGEVVRVVTFGPSIELCGGTHAQSTGEIGHFVLLSEAAIAAGTRRVEGLVSEAADAYVRRLRSAVEDATTALSSSVEELPQTATRLALQRRELEKKITALQSQVAESHADSMLALLREADGVRYVAARTPQSAIGLREFAESLRVRMQSGVLALCSSDGRTVSLLVTVSADAVARGVSAKRILTEMASHVAGKGGGSALQAQGAGKNPAGVDAALAAVPAAISSALDE
ncbi:MAG: alanine--tRNA ligase [Candidatus Eremiobacteraeota bacterium]|nr:alanine--tRNA ligase [Candidatus Eremiobacteraeota bacterium]MBC5826887.1 alanine--tRNA ligase [Candidatus Eremiobacteraeota bacterium]